MYIVYALKSKKHNYIYVGMTNNLPRRINEHNSGKGRATKPYVPFDLIYTAKFKHRNQARRQEVYLKSGSGKEFLKSLL